MKHRYTHLWKVCILFSLVLLVKPVFGQCPEPQLYDLNFTKATSNPQWENCIDNASDPDDFTLTLISPEDVHDYEIDFGDGSPVVSGALWPANTAITHTYGLGIFNVKLSETQNGCTTSITGHLTNDRKAGATAIPPTTGTSGCVPHTLTFINQSTNTSPFTVFEWDWGDGTTEIVGPENVGKPMSHTFEKGKAGCDMVVSLTAYSLCDTTFSSYGPYDFWDIDTAVVTASATKICGGQDITFTDQTLYNCNVKQPRKIRWDFTEVGGPVTGWLPATPENKSQTYFISGDVGDKFTVFMEDSNYCGVDPAAVTVEIIGPPQAVINVPNPTICAGQEGVFLNESTGDADLYIWDFGDDSDTYSTGSIDEVSHVYNTPGTYTVELISAISGTELCRDTTTATIEVLPSSVSDFTLDKYSGCAPLSVTITEKSQNATTWSWNLGGMSTSSSQNPAPIEFTEEGTYEIELETSNSLGCGSRKTVTVTVFPSVTVDAEVDSVCFGSEINFKDKSYLSSESGECAKGSILYEKWENIAGDQVSDLTSSGDFPDAPSNSSLLTSFEAPVNNGGDFGSRIRGYICPPQNGNYVFWIASDDNSELWLSTDANPENKVKIASVDGFTSSRQWNKFSSQQSVPIYLASGQKYYIEAVHKEGTGGDNLAVGWQLPSGARERPIGGNRLSPFSEGSVINTWNWDFGNGDTSDEQDPSYTYPSAGDYTVELSVSTGKCAASKTFPVKVSPPTVADFWQSDTAACTPFTVEFADLATADSLIWNFGDNTPTERYEKGSQDTVSHTFINNTTANQNYYITLIAKSGAGCQDTVIKKVTVYPGPKADFDFSPAVPQCSPVSVTFNNKSASADSYKWYFGTFDSSATTASSFEYDFVNKSGVVRHDTVTLQAFSNSGCYGQKTEVVTVFPEPDFDITADPDTACHPANVKFSVSGSPSTYLWDFGDGTASTSVSPDHEYLNNSLKDTVFTVAFYGSSPFGCKDTVYKDVVINPSPDADFVTDVSSGCSPLTVNFENLSVGANVNIWNYGTGEIDTLNTINHSYTFKNTSSEVKTYEVRLTIQNTSGCIDEKVVSVMVYPETEASFTPIVSSGCSPLDLSFVNSSTGASNFIWNFGDGTSSVDASPGHVFKNNSLKDTVFNVNLYTSSSHGCKDTVSGSVTVYALPKADFITDLNEGCSPLSVEFSSLAQNSDSTSWNFGDGSSAWGSSAQFNHEFTNSGFAPQSYTVKQEVYTQNGCKDVKSTSVEVYPEVSAFFVASDTASCTPFNVQFSNLSTNADHFMWDFANGATSINKSPGSVFENNIEKDTMYEVTLIATSSYNCQAEFKKQITVYPAPKPSFVLAPSTGCSPLNVSVQNNSNGATGYLWEFGDGEESTENNAAFSKEYENLGSKERTYRMKLTATSVNGCKDTVSRPVKVYPAVNANIASTDTAGCSPFEVSFFDNSFNAGSYNWSFGDGSYSAIPSPKHTFINSSSEEDTTYEVTMIASNSYLCKDTVSRQILVFAKPKAEFLLDKLSGCSPLTIDVTNSSLGAEKYTWNYGSDSSDTNSDPSFSYTFVNSVQTVENHDIKLDVVSENGCEAAAQKTIRVFPEVTAAFESDPNGCTPFTVKLNNNSIGGATYTWDLGDGQISTENSPFHTYANISRADTVFAIELVAVSGYGCSDTLNDEITVYSKPKADFSVSPSVIQLPDSTVNIVNSSSPGDWTYSWDFGDGEKSSQKDPLKHYYDFYGTYKIALAVSGSNCSDTTYRVVTVNPTKPIAKFEGAGEGCSPVVVQFENTSKFADGFYWDFGDGTISDLKNPKHMFDFPGTYTVTLKVSGQGGDDIIVMEDAVTVYPVPVAFFTVKPNDRIVKIPGNSHYFANLSENAAQFHWDFGDGSTSMERSPFHAYTKVGTYDVTLTATNEFGCSNTYSEESAAIAEAGGKIVVPNAFTPTGGGNLNSAGRNDYFNPLSEGVVEFHMQIFNRWGELIFETFELEPGWDGTYRGKLCKQDVYVYKLKAKFVDGEVVEKVGDVTLIR